MPLSVEIWSDIACPWAIAASGAQPPALLRELLERAWAQRSATPAA